MTKGLLLILPITTIVLVTQPCKVNNHFPDMKCTPGVVTSAIKEDVCTKNYTKKVRHVTDLTKKIVFKEYGITSHKIGEYEIDHFVPLELGGSNDIRNLWPEKATPVPGFHEKDRVENYLHRQVCNGKMSLEEAQNGIIKNWTFYLDLANTLKEKK